MTTRFGDEMSLHSIEVCEGREAPSKFFARTRDDWHRLARYLMARCRVPDGADEDDVVQVLQIEAWRVIKKYDPKRGANPDSYVMFNSIVRAKRWLKQQARRGGVGARPELESRDALLDDAERASSKLARLQQAESVQPVQEIGLERADELKRLLDGCASIRTKIVLETTWRAGDVDAAGQAIYDDKDLRLMYRLDCRGDARRVVVNELKRAHEETRP